LFRFFISLIALFLFSTEIYALNTIKDAKIGQNGLILNFSEPIDTDRVRHFPLKNSKTVRYVFDFKDTIIRSRSMAKKLSHKGVSSFRISQFDRETIRVVIEVPKSYPVRYDKVSSKSYQISLPNLSSKRAGSPSDLFASLGTKKHNKARKIIKKAYKPKAHIMKSAVKRPKKRYTIVVDAGHGGKDSGALGGSRKYMEKVVVLKIAKKLRTHLKALGFKVHMTRTKNRYVKLGTRTRYANKKHADAFISIHANAVVKSKQHLINGIETYYLQVSRSARSKRVAARENSVVLQKKDRVSKNVILNLMTGPKIVMSNKLAIDVQKGMLRNVHTKYRTAKDNGVRPAPFWVLVGAQMPSVLVEAGYITHPKDRKRLFSPAYQDLIAKGIAQGVSTYFANREKELE